MRAKSEKLPFVEGKMPMTKIDAALRQLEAAITIWFADGDPVAVCSLAFAAHEILFALNQHSKTGVRSISHFESVKPEYRDEAASLFRADPNFCKHGGKDPTETHFLAIETLPIVLLDASILYSALGFGRRAVLETMMQWIRITHPEVFANGDGNAFGGGMDSKGIVAFGKQAFFATAIPMYMRSLLGMPVTPA